MTNIKVWSRVSRKLEPEFLSSFPEFKEYASIFTKLEVNSNVILFAEESGTGVTLHFSIGKLEEVNGKLWYFVEEGKIVSNIKIQFRSLVAPEYRDCWHFHEVKSAKMCLSRLIKAVECLESSGYFTQRLQIETPLKGGGSSFTYSGGIWNPEKQGD